MLTRDRDGLFDVERDRRLVRSGIDRTRAVRLIAEQFADGDRVLEVDSDGTSRDITRMVSSRR